ncbi:sigma-54-dependent transcriptional regulator [Salinispira pacifica]|uniref:Sigma-54 dependent DNA-binding response regulator n=1 Tax=Salinispira pacifica TaxID=1307761 RepID=V5WJ72_9SPIO|nr:sigma-54 dependent transcriptional regulator [Salinispira pacifica]AHC15833.1 Sigma-54 dependent DNA-binding response regulator [Salinispira pacifica]
MTRNILVVDDEHTSVELYSMILREHGYDRVIPCEDSRNAAGLIREHDIELVISDLMMPVMDGYDLLLKINEEHPDIAVIILTAQDKVETAVECMKIGAFDFITKPLDPERLLTAVEHAFTIRELKEEVNILSTERPDRELSHPGAFSEILTRSPKMKKIFAYMEAIIPSPKPLLITGESGTGKELIARAFHELANSGGDFVAINVSGLDDAVFSDSLFGHHNPDAAEGGDGRKGLIEQAGKGTLFLDEIGDLGMNSQIKLLRLLQEGEFFPLGSDTPVPCRARIVAATNANLKSRQESGDFRRDLYYRLIAHHIELPPLRDRTDDIPLLLDAFLAEALEKMGRPEVKAPPELYAMLKTYPFPGNVRELQGLMYDMVTASAPGSLDISVIRNYILLNRAGEDGDGSSELSELMDDEQYARGPGGMLLRKDKMPNMKDAEEFLYEQALERAGGNQSRAAKLLDVSQSTLSRWKQQFSPE